MVILQQIHNKYNEDANYLKGEKKLGETSPSISSEFTQQNNKNIIRDIFVFMKFIKNIFLTNRNES